MLGLKNKWVVPVLALALVATACSDDPADEGGDEPNVASIVLTVGAQTVTWTRATGAITGGPILLAPNTNVTVTASSLLSNGSADPVVTPTTFELRVTPANANVTFTRTGAFTGTLRGTVAGNTSITFALFHLAEGHNEYDFSVPVTIAVQ